MKQNLFIGAVLLSLSSYAFSADTATTQQSGVPITSQTDASQQKGTNQASGSEQNNNTSTTSEEKAPQKKSIADYCRDPAHTC
jgi:hypothetical protein